MMEKEKKGVEECERRSRMGGMDKEIRWERKKGLRKERLRRRNRNKTEKRTSRRKEG